MSDHALPALTGALVDANDRLLGLIGLTEITLTSLDEGTRVETIALQAIDLLHLDGLRLDSDPGATRTWGEPLEEPQGSWSATRSLDELGSLEVTCWRSSTFDTGDQKLLEAVANLIASAVRTARQHEAALAQVVIAQEHDTAARLTAASLRAADRLPTAVGVDMHVHATPARQTGGDLWLCRRIGDAVWFAVGDISGKGLPAAVLMSTVVSAATAAIDRYNSEGVGAVIEAIESWVYEPLEAAGLFSTFAVGRWTPDGRAMIANAGHSPVLKVVGGTETRLEATSPPLGVIGGILPAVEEHQLGAGDVIVIATDGFTEQRNNDGVVFGEDIFDALVADTSVCSSATDIGTALVAAVVDHAAGADQDDDRTLFTLKVLS